MIIEIHSRPHSSSSSKYGSKHKKNIFFQQDLARPYVANAVLYFLNDILMIQSSLIDIVDGLGLYGLGHRNSRI
jgi:hypothetical protein